MKIDVKKENDFKKYLLLDENDEIDISKLKEFTGKLCDLNILDKTNGYIKQVSPKELKTFFTENKNELESLIKSIVNLSYSNTKEKIEDSLNTEVSASLSGILTNSGLLKYKDEVTILPDKCNPGDVYVLKISDDIKQYYICVEKDKFLKLLTENDLNKTLQNYYTKEEINQKINQFLNDLDAKILNFKNSFSDCMTVEQYNQKYNEYNERLTNLRNEINSLKSELQSILDS